MTPSTPTIEAIPTTYAGTTFRSRLEANWALTLDGLCIRWEYEPTHLTLPSGTTYIPDFWLPDLGTWIEVKGTSIPGTEKAIQLGKTRACHCATPCTCEWPGGELVLIGHPPTPYEMWTDPDYEHQPLEVLLNKARRHHGYLNWSTAHGRPTYFTTCPRCRTAGWFELRAPVQCRACRGPLIGAHAYRPLDKELTFCRGQHLALPVFPMPAETTTP